MRILSILAPFWTPIWDQPVHSGFWTPFNENRWFSMVQGLLFLVILALFFGTPFQSSLVHVLFFRFWGPAGINCGAHGLSFWHYFVCTLFEQIWVPARDPPERIGGMSDVPFGGQVKPHFGTESSAKP
mgnify:FL=1